MGRTEVFQDGMRFCGADPIIKMESLSSNSQCRLRVDRLCMLLLTMTCLLSVTCIASFAATISPGLQAVLQASPAGEEISVIVNLAGKADLSQIKDFNKELRRSKIIKTLKDQADLRQGPLRALLQNRRSKRLIALWISNPIAVTVPASLNRVCP